MATETEIETVVNRIFNTPGNAEIIQNMFSHLQSTGGSDLETAFDTSRQLIDASQQLIANAMGQGQDLEPVSQPILEPVREQVPLDLVITPILPTPENLSHLPVIPAMRDNL